MELLFDYLGFLARAITIVIAIMVVFGFLFANAARSAPPTDGSLQVKHLNAELKELKHTLTSATATPAEQKRLDKLRKKEDKALAKSQAKEEKAKAKSGGIEAVEDTRTGRVFVLNFKGDIQASSVELLRREVTSVLTTAEPQDEVVVRLESAGGLVHAYGLAASQLKRVCEAGVKLTATVDQVAASGGYLMAAVADKIIAAPFAVVGSIGVVAQIPNVHRLLKKYDVDVDVITAGEHKRTLTVLGENTDEGRAKFTEQLEEVHSLFQDYILQSRENLDMKQVATGETWYGERALGLNLVDAIMTSDSYLVGLAAEREVYELSWQAPKRPLQRLLGETGRHLQNASRMLAQLISGRSPL